MVTYKTKILHYLMTRNTNLNDPWLRTLDHNFFRHIGNSQKVKLLTTVYVISQLISKYNYKYILVKMERGKTFEFSNFHKLNFQFLLSENVTINFEHCDFFQKH